MVTIKDVAKYAGVSHGTVSNVLNGAPSVSLENIKKVEEAIRVLGYQPNISARNLKSSHDRDVAVVLPNISDSLFAALYTTLDELFTQREMSVRLFLTDDMEEKELSAFDELRRQQIRSAVVVTCQPDNAALFSELLKSGMRLVFVEREPQGLDCNFISFRNDKSVYSAVNTLLDRGVKKIALITSLQSFSSEQLCVEGYRRALMENDLPVETAYIRMTAGTREDGFKAAIDLITHFPELEAIVCSSTLLLHGVIRAAHLAHQEHIVRAAALGDDPWNKEMYPYTLLFSRPYFEMASKIVDLLLENMENSAFFEYKQIALSPLRLSAPKKEAAQFVSTSQKLKVAIVDGEMAHSIRCLLPDLQRKLNIEVSLDILPYEKLYANICSDRLRREYDLFTLDTIWLQEFVSKGYLADITERISDEFRETVDISQPLWKNFSRVNGRYFTVPYHYCNQLIFYRKDLFEDPVNKRMFFEQYRTELRCPRTWLEYNAVARFFTREYNPSSQTVYGTTLGGDYPNAAAYDFLPRFWAYGGELFDKHGAPAVNSKNALKALENYRESYKYASPASPGNWLYGQVDEFISGQAAMMILSSAYASAISDPSQSKISGKVGFEQIPGGNPIHWIWAFAVNDACPHKDVAFAFIRWICDKDLAVPTTLLGNISACAGITTNAELYTRYPWISKSLSIEPESFLQYLPHSKSLISPHNIIDTIAQLVHLCVAGERSAEETLQEMGVALEHIVAD